ncbi:hypothetical protein Tco_1245468 [Tanacetum coccineum]
MLFGIGRFNNYAVLQSIPCSPEWKIVGHILLDHSLSYALTATADVLAVYLQQFWKTVSKAPNTKDTIRYKLDMQEITYTVDMFRDTLKLPVETQDNLFIALVTIRTAELFMQTVGYQGVLDKVSAFFTKFLAQPWQTMFKVFNHCLSTKTYGHDQTKINILPLFHVVVNRTNVDYAALLWWDFMNWNVLFRGMQILDAFLTDEIHATDVYQEYETLFVRQSTTLIPPPSDDRERDEIANATLLSLTLHKTALVAEAQENVAKVQEKLAEEEIEKMVEGEEDVESYASEFADSTFNDDDDSGTRIEPESYKKNPKVVVNDDVTKNKDNKKDENEVKEDDVEKPDDEVEKKDNDDHTDHTLVRTHATGSMETRNEQMQAPIPTLTRSPRKDLSLDKTISKELTENVSPTTATTSKSKSKR